MITPCQKDSHIFVFIVEFNGNGGGHRKRWSDCSDRRERERELYLPQHCKNKKKTIQMVNMWQAARKGLMPIELATKKKKKKFKNTNIR